MAKHLILILLSILFVSCATRKTDVSKVDSVVKTDSTSVTKKETVTTQNNHVIVTTNTDELEIVPIDTSKCIEVDGKKYRNVKLRYKKTKKVLVDTTKIKVSEKVLIKANVKKAASVKALKKNIYKKANYSIYTWLILILLFFLVGFYAYKKINKTLF